MIKQNAVDLEPQYSELWREKITYFEVIYSQSTSTLLLYQRKLNQWHSKLLWQSTTNFIAVTCNDCNSCKATFLAGVWSSWCDDLLSREDAGVLLFELLLVELPPVCADLLLVVFDLVPELAVVSGCCFCLRFLAELTVLRTSVWVKESWTCLREHSNRN